MATKKKPQRRQNREGVSINARNVSIGGDVVGRDKIANTQSGSQSGEMVKLVELFSAIQKKIEARKDDSHVDKSELKSLVENIQEEAQKGEEANPTKVERWLRFLAEMADDIFQVTVVALTNPMAGVAKAIQLIAQKAKENKS